MSQVESEPRWSGPCWDCGAENDPGASECWLCHRRDWHGSSRLPTSPKPAPSRMSDHEWPLIGLWLTLGLVGLGGVVLAPGLVFGLLVTVLLMLILVGSPLVGAKIIAQRRLSTTQKVVRMAVLVVMTPIVLFVVLFIAIFLSCLFRGPQWHN